MDNTRSEFNSVSSVRILTYGWRCNLYSSLFVPKVVSVKKRFDLELCLNQQYSNSLVLIIFGINIAAIFDIVFKKIIHVIFISVDFTIVFVDMVSNVSSSEHLNI